MKIPLSLYPKLKVMEQSQLMKDDPIINRRVKEAINLLKHVDGETFNYVIKELSFDDYLENWYKTEKVGQDPLDPKELFIQDLENRIMKNLGSSLTTSFETSSAAPSFGWSREEYMYMPIVAEKLRKQGFTITSKVNHGVTDWSIAR